MHEYKLTMTWNHPQNDLPIRHEEIFPEHCDEAARAEAHRRIKVQKDEIGSEKLPHLHFQSQLARIILLTEADHAPSSRCVP